MSERFVLDASQLPSLVFKSRSILWWGAWGIVAVEATMFALLGAAYFYLRLGVDVWPPPGVELPGLALPSIELGLLIASCYPAYLASEAAIKQDADAVRKNLIVNLALALVALAIRIFVWRGFNFAWHSSAYGSIVWAILGLHTFDYILGVLETVVIAVIFFAPRIGDKQWAAIEFDSLTWYFVVASWIPMYGILYIAVYLLRANR